MGLLAGMSVVSIVELIYSVKTSCQQKQVQEEDEQATTAPRIAWGNETHALYQISKYFVEFIKSSDIHGVHFIKDQSLTKRGRMFWFVLVLSSVLICSIIVTYTYKHAEKSPVATRIDSKLMTLDDVSAFVNFD